MELDLSNLGTVNTMFAALFRYVAYPCVPYLVHSLFLTASCITLLNFIMRIVFWILDTLLLLNRFGLVSK